MFHDRETVIVPVFVIDRIIKGAIAMSEDGWYIPDKNRRDIRGCINVPTMTHKATLLAKANPQHTNLAQRKAKLS